MTSSTLSGQAQPAGFARRIAAACYDALLLGGLLMASSFIVVIARGGTAVAPGDRRYLALLLMETAAFYVFFWWRGGQTLGMRAWRIRVETVDGAPLGLARAMLRFGASLLSLGMAGLGVIWILIDPQKRACHDLLSATRVVHTR
jgi:uncharacterized RDD family membrane protein YckC